MKNKLTHLFIITLVLQCFIHSTRLLGQTYLGSFTEIKEICSTSNNVVFCASDDFDGVELWKTNGNKRTTSLLKDITTSPNGSNPSNLTSMNGIVYFSAYDIVRGNELWRTDGTIEGTYLVKDIRTGIGTSNPGSNPSQFILFNNELYFIASDDGNDGDLWKTDGTEAGTEKVFETDYIDIQNLTVVGENLFFVRNYGPMQLWQYNAITKTASIIEVDDFYCINTLKSFNNSLYLLTQKGFDADIRLYRYDPNDQLLTLLKEYPQPGYGSIYVDNFVENNGQLFFCVRNHFQEGSDTDALWKTDGTVEGTITVTTYGWDYHLSGSNMENFISFNNLLFFKGGYRQGGYLFQSDGTASGTKPFYNIEINQSVKPKSLNGRLFFGSGADLWITDGTKTGTRKYSDVKLLTYADPTVFYTENGNLYFKGNDELGLALYNEIPNAEITVKLGYKYVKSGDELKFKSKVDSVTHYKFDILNNGEKELSVSKILVSGTDFYLEGKINTFIQPGSSSTFELMYFPHAEGMANDILEIFTNDENEGAFKINLQGTTSGISNSFPSDSLNLYKEIIPVATIPDSIHLDNCNIAENADLESIVGQLTFKNDSTIQFSFVNGVGDRDNSFFTIVGNKLQTRYRFDYESNSCLNVRIKAADSIGNIYEQPFVINVLNVNENKSFDTCNNTLSHLSYSLNDVAFLDNNTLVAVGAKGSIIKSRNFGDSWYKVSSGTSWNLISIQFVSDTVGYILDSGGKILKTENAGEDWFLIELPIQTYPYPNELIFVNERIGYVIGNGVYKTQDGGKSWETLSKGLSDSYNAGYFFNENKGFLCYNSSRLQKTEDGGKSWKTINCDYLGWNIRFIDIQFTSEKIGFTLGLRGGVYKTTDGGDTWGEIGKISTDYTTDLNFINDTVGYVTAGWYDTGIYKTVDGGITWSSTDSLNSGSIMAIDFSPDKSRGCAVGLGSSLGSTGEDGRTIDLLSNGQWSYNSVLREADFKSVSFINDTSAFVFGQKHFKTSDLGVTWKEMAIDNDYEIIDSYFIDEDTGYAIDEHYLYKTTDGGDSWKKIDDGSINAYLKTIYFFNNNLGFITGFNQNGLVYRTINGGLNWEKIDIAGTVSIIDMVFLDINKGFAITDYSKDMLTTNDGGSTWSSIKINSPNRLTTLGFWDKLNGMALGYGGIEYKTQDGGLTWELVESGMRWDFTSMYLVDSLKGYAVCQTTVYETLDQGKSWTSITPYDEEYHIGGFDHTLLFVGERGLVYLYKQQDPPPIPGYISGLDAVPVNAVTTYKIPQSDNSNYVWEVDGKNTIEYSMNMAKIKWNETGQHTLKVKPYNSCASANARELSVIVEDIPEIEILGEDTVVPYSKETYQVNADSSSRYSWKVLGFNAYQQNNNSIDISWGEPAKGIVEVIETKLKSGVRKKAIKNVLILDSLLSIPLNLNIINFNNTNEDRCFNAQNEITVAGNGTTLLLEGGSATNLIAGQSIVLLPGFHAKNGSYMDARIKSDGSFCDQQKSLISSPVFEKSSLLEEADGEGNYLKPKYLKVYPNPNSGRFTLELGNFGNEVELYIYNSIGHLLNHFKTFENQNWIELKTVTRGIYFIRAIDGKETFVEKFIIE